MVAFSKIEWCDHTFNPWEGCTKVSPGCAHCYAEARNRRFSGGANWGKGAPRRLTSPANWIQPQRWNREAAVELNDWNWHAALHGGMPHCPEPRRPRVFCASLADWLDDEVPVEWLDALLKLIHATPFLDWLLLTKRPENWRSRLRAVMEMPADDKLGHALMVAAWLGETDGLIPEAPHNVWVGTTVEDQVRANERIPTLLKIPAKMRFLSCEPLLGPVNLTLDDAVMAGGYNSLKPYRPEGCTTPEQPRIDWVICGGESGPDARPMHPDWARSLRDQCAAAGTPYFFKQWGEWVPWGRGVTYPKGTPSDFVMLNGSKYFPGNFSSSCMTIVRVGKHVAGRLLDDKEHSEFPIARATA